MHNFLIAIALPLYFIVSATASAPHITMDDLKQAYADRNHATA